MINTRLTTAVLTGAESAAEFAVPYNYYWVRNDGTDNIYVSLSSGIQPGADGVLKVPVGAVCCTMHDYPATKLYLLGTGSVQICGTSSAFCPFKAAPKGGDKEGEAVLKSISFSSTNILADTKLTYNSSFTVIRTGNTATITVPADLSAADWTALVTGVSFNLNKMYKLTVNAFGYGRIGISNIGYNPATYYGQNASGYFGDDYVSGSKLSDGDNHVIENSSDHVNFASYFYLNKYTDTSEAAATGGLWFCGDVLHSDAREAFTFTASLQEQTAM